MMMETNTRIRRPLDLLCSWCIGNSEKAPLDTRRDSLSWMDVSANSPVHQAYVCRRPLPQNAKIVYSIYNDDFKTPFRRNLQVN